ncbi:MAG: PQQ-binding-like beta-propeller repeat protein [Prevotellaceae bacterium]|jgi:outer membrane protein assembly factor BamB|nr:PQQ-binding-like beta-propeller repeat protein [Prevotellaceae bacterium]
MKKKIFRNIAIVSAIFTVTFSIMLITNYFQVRGFNPLQAEVVETLRQINDENAGNLKLQEQIRQLDLLARRAYFVRLDHLMVGVYILVGMLAVFVVSLRLYYAKEKDIPGRQVSPADDWATKTRAREYVGWIAGGLAVAALTLAFFTTPFFKSGTNASDAQHATVAQAASGEAVERTELADMEAEGTPLSAEVNDEDSGGSGDDSVAVKEGEMKADLAEASASKPGVTHNCFRGNTSNAISPARNVPTSWNLATGENIAWASKIPRHGFNSPVINGNKVFITGADEQARELYCYDLTTGQLLWTLAASNIAGSPAQMPETTEDTGLAASTVATNGRQVCAIFASGDLICADMDGRRLWAKNLGVPENHYGYASSLLAFGSSLIVQYDNSKSPKVMALDMATGVERWVKNRTDKITWSSPIIAYVNGQPQLVLMGCPSITAYNPGSGEQYWRVEGLSGEVASSPCSAAGVVFGASEYAALIAVNATTGETLWTASDFLPEVSSPVATESNVYLATSYGVLACYDAKTGELVRSHELNTEFYSSPVITEGKLYVFSNSGTMFIYSANRDFSLLNSFDTGQKTFATPAFTDGRIVVRTENSIYCVAEKKQARS